MAKDINIHVRTPGAAESKQQLDGVSQSAQKIGDSTEQMGSRSSRAMDWFMTGLKSLAGPLGFAALATAAATTAIKIAQFFDSVKTKSDEAVRNLADVRKEFADLFEAMDAFDEKSRQKITLDVAKLLQQTAVPKEIGLPIINQYTRQFKGEVDAGRLTQAQYDEGLQGMLGWGARHGGAATPELIQLMAGWKMTTPQQQGEFRRMLTAAAGPAGLQEEDLITSLGRASPTALAMGWTPQQTVEAMAIIAQGEVGRKKAAMPATTIEAIGAPQIPSAETMGITGKGPEKQFEKKFKELAKTPQALFDYLQQTTAGMSQQDRYNTLSAFYGAGATPGVLKLMGADRGLIGGLITGAAGPGGIAAEQAEEQARMGTLEAKRAKAAAVALKYYTEVEPEEVSAESVRAIGKEKRKIYLRKQPVLQKLMDKFIIGEEAESEYGAYRAWLEKLPPEELKAIYKKYPLMNITTEGIVPPGRKAWLQMTEEQKMQSLIKGEDRGENQTINIHYHNETIYNPRGDDQRGPRFTQD